MRLTSHSLVRFSSADRFIRSIRPTHGAIPDPLRLKFKQNLVDLLRRNRAVDQGLLLTGLVILGSVNSQFPGSSLSQVSAGKQTFAKQFQRS